MDHPMTKEESYADRRQLFKNIWDTAMTVDEKEGNIIHNKPKVIKTLKLDEVKQCAVGKKKKQRIKNLRSVCNKLLDFCDRQDADDMFYEQMASKDRKSPLCKENKDMLKKSKVTKVRNAKRAKSMFTPINPVLALHTSPDRSLKINNLSRNYFPLKLKGPSLTIQGSYRKRENIRRVEKHLEPKMLIHECRKYTNKQPFPINKITIN